MRKHFLILMLMALLPMAGFAIDLDQSKFSIANHEYGTSTALALTATGYTVNTDYTCDLTKFYSNADLSDTPVSTALAELPVGMYYVKVVPAGSYSGGPEFAVSFRVYGAIITIDFAASQNKDYGQGDPAAFSYTLKRGSADFDNTGNVLGLTVGRVGGEDKGTYAFTFDWENKTNYTVQRPSSDLDVFTINTKTVSSPGFTLGTEALTYNATAQAPTITVKDGETVIPASQYTVTYAYCATQTGTYGSYGDAHTNAGWYKVKVTAKPDVNYNFTPISDQGPFQIKQAPLNVYVNDYHKTYDGTKDLPTDLSVAYSGLQGADASNAEPFGPNAFTFAYVTPLASDGNKWVTTTGYALRPTATSAAMATVTYKNYNVSTLNTGKLYVDRKVINIKPVDGLHKSFGDPTPTFASTDIDASEAISADRSNIQKGYTISRTSTEEAVKVYKDDLHLTLKSNPGATIQNILNQYTIKPGTADFEIVAAELYVYPKSVSKTYGQSYSLDDFEIIATNSNGVTVNLSNASDLSVRFKGLTENPTIPGVYVLEIVGTPAAEGYATANKMEGQFIINKANLTITPQAQVLHIGDKATALIKDKVAFTGRVGSDVIGYKLEFNTYATQETYVAGLIPNANISAVPTDVKYTRTECNTENSSITGFVAAGTEIADATGMTIANGYTKDYSNNDALVDDVNDIYLYNTNIGAAKNNPAYITTNDVKIPAQPEASDALDAEDKLQGATTTYAKGIKVSLVASTTAAPNVNDYYNITFNATAALNVVAATSLAFMTDDNDWNEIVKFDDKTAGSVTMLTRADQPLSKYDGKWKAEEWNTIILPFETSARLLSQAFGYAIVNVVDKDKTTTGNVQFKLQMKGTIDANTPIAIKTDADINAGDVINFGNINGKKIVKPATKKVSVEAGAGHTFVGVYETTKIDKTTPSYYFLLNGAWKYIKADSDLTFNIVPFNCYIDQSNTSAHELTFTFEEADGSTTAIKAVEASATESNNAAVKYTGWYTINGVKLDAAPTQKGMYIFNGKKYVVK